MVMIFHSYASLPDGKWGLVEWLVEVFIWFVGDYALTHALNWPVVQCLKGWQKILSTARVGIWVWNAFLKAWSWLMIACKILGFVTMKILLWTFWASKIWGDNTLINHGWCFICSYHVIHELRAFMKMNHYFTSDMFRRAVGEHFKRLIGQYPTTMERSVGEARNGWFIHVYPQHIVILWVHWHQILDAYPSPQHAVPRGWDDTNI